MSISVYTGVVGSGKSYEAVKSVVLPQYEKGRRIVTNISGLNEQKIREYLIKKGKDPEGFGEIVHVTNERIAEDNFFCGEPEPEFKFEVPDWIPSKQLYLFAQNYPLVSGKTFGVTAYQLLLPQLKLLHANSFDIGSCLLMAIERGWKTLPIEWFDAMPRDKVFAQLPPPLPSIVQGGDLVILDEVWRYWADTNTISAEHMNFVRMHRHYLNDYGVSCDMLLMIQDFASLHRNIRGVCELVLKFQKHKNLGLSSRYSIKTYDGRPSKATLVSASAMQKYDKEIFPLYQSYDRQAGKEITTDDRQNIFKNKKFIFSSLFGFFLLGLSGYTALVMFSNMKNGRDMMDGTVLSSKKKSEPHTIQNNPFNPNKTTVSNSVQTSQTSSSKITPAPQIPTVFPGRLVGIISPKNGQPIYLLKNEDGSIVRHFAQLDSSGWNSVFIENNQLIIFKTQTTNTSGTQAK